MYESAAAQTLNRQKEWGTPLGKRKLESWRPVDERQVESRHERNVFQRKNADRKGRQADRKSGNDLPRIRGDLQPSAEDARRQNACQLLDERESILESNRAPAASGKIRLYARLLSILRGK